MIDNAVSAENSLEGSSRVSIPVDRRTHGNGRVPYVPQCGAESCRQLLGSVWLLSPCRLGIASGVPLC